MTGFLRLINRKEITMGHEITMKKLSVLISWWEKEALAGVCIIRFYVALMLSRFHVLPVAEHFQTCRGLLEISIQKCRISYRDDCVLQLSFSKQAIPKPIFMLNFSIECSLISAMPNLRNETKRNETKQNKTT
jgi:hypothetical protein